MMGSALQFIGEYERATACYDNIIRYAPDNSAAWYQRGMCLAKRGIYNDALNSFSHVINGPAGASVNWINNNIDLSLFEKQQTDTTKKMNLDVTEIRMIEVQGEALMHLGNFADAYSCFAKITESHPDNMNAWRNCAEALYNLGEYGGAVEAYNVLLNKYPEDTLILEKKGMALLHLGNDGEAIEIFNAVLEKDPSNIIALHNRTDAQLKHGRFEEALAGLTEITEHIPNDQASLSLKAQILLDSGRYPEALEALEPIISQGGSDVNAWRNYITILEKNGDYAEAVAAIENLENAGIADSSLLCQKAKLLNYAGNLNAAADAYAAALQTDPDREGVALALAENLKILGRYNEAAKAYEHHVRANREDGLAWKELGLAMMKIGETEKAKKSLRKARELLPDDAGIALIRADILLNARDFDEACTAYEETLELIPDSVPAMRGHALALAGAGRNKEASAEFEKYLDKEEDDNDMRIAYGAVCEKLGEFELAIGHYAAILEEKDDLNLWLRLLGILKMMGRYEDCAEGCEDLIGKKPECAEAYRILAEVKYRLGEFKKSAESYEKALELEPSNKAGRLTYAETLLKAGRYKEALQNFGIALDGSSGEGDCVFF